MVGHHLCRLYPPSPCQWRRLRIIAVEDVGMGLPVGPVLIDVLQRNFNASPGGDWMMACHAVRLLASAPKDRTSAEHADWVATRRTMEPQ